MRFKTGNWFKCDVCGKMYLELLNESIISCTRCNSKKFTWWSSEYQ